MDERGLDHNLYKYCSCSFHSAHIQWVWVPATVGSGYSLNNIGKD